MRFHELKKGQPFRFQSHPYQVYWSAGVDGMYGRYATGEDKLRDPAWWHYCGPRDHVTAEPPPDGHAEP